MHAQNPVPVLISLLGLSLLGNVQACPVSRAKIPKILTSEADLLTIEPTGYIKLNPNSTCSDVNVRIICKAGNRNGTTLSSIGLHRVLDRSDNFEKIATWEVFPRRKSVFINRSSGFVSQTEEGDGLVLTLFKPCCGDKARYVCTIVQNDLGHRRVVITETLDLNFTVADSPVNITASPNRSVWRSSDVLTLTCNIVLDHNKSHSLNNTHLLGWSWDYQDSTEEGTWRPLKTPLNATVDYHPTCDRVTHSSVYVHIITPEDHNRTFRCSAQALDNNLNDTVRVASFVVRVSPSTAAPSTLTPKLTDVLVVLAVSFVLVAGVWMGSSYYYSRRFDKTFTIIQTACEAETYLSSSSTQVLLFPYGSSTDSQLFGRQQGTSGKGDFSDANAARGTVPVVAPWKLADGELNLPRATNLPPKLIWTIREPKDADLNAESKNVDGRKGAGDPEAPPPVTFALITGPTLLTESVVNLPADHALRSFTDAAQPDDATSSQISDTDQTQKPQLDGSTFLKDIDGCTSTLPGLAFRSIDSASKSNTPNGSSPNGCTPIGSSPKSNTPNDRPPNDSAPKDHTPENAENTTTGQNSRDQPGSDISEGNAGSRGEKSVSPHVMLTSFVATPASSRCRTGGRGNTRQHPHRLSPRE
ncbi:hypothetical protein V1264_006093 [Littorina saxatilis]|uniref:Ig-like domain-containing protein n=1 Tax=Littorina saxatilis TaxID=31220 RepID=A0AAN9AWG3_9CAEN